MTRLFKYLTFLSVFILLASCSSQMRPVVHQNWDDNINFPLADPDFSKYTDQVQTYLSGHSLSIRTESEISLNTPFEFSANANVPYRGKFLLIHGLSDSTYVWRDMAQNMVDRGFDVRAILLSGHGSHPVNMLNVTYNEWLFAARQHFENWDVDDAPIYLGGFSMGAVIASILALENPEIAGLLLVSPAFHSQLNSKLRWAWIYKWYKPWIFNGMILEDNPTKYNSIPVNSGAQYYAVTEYLKDHWDKNILTMPVLMISTMDDSVGDVHYNRAIFEKYFDSDKQKFLIYSNDPEEKPNTNEIIRPSSHPDLRILNQSHLSLINSPTNALYGKNGTLLVCNGNDYPTFSTCMRAKNHWYGAQHTPTPDGIPVARTTYNPDFSSIVELFEEVFSID
jgi:esterase/lipase